MATYINYQMRGKDNEGRALFNPLMLSLGPDCQLKGRKTGLAMPAGSGADTQPSACRPLSFCMAGRLPQPSLLPRLPCFLRPFSSMATSQFSSVQFSHSVVSDFL